MVGIDIVKVERIAKLRERFGLKGLKKFLLESEIAEFKKAESIAGVWASKEAISKALGVGIGKKLQFHDIQIYRDNFGKPRFKLSDKIVKNFGIKEGDISISHDGDYAIAVAIILKEE